MAGFVVLCTSVLWGANRRLFDGQEDVKCQSQCTRRAPAVMPVCASLYGVNVDLSRCSGLL